MKYLCTYCNTFVYDDEAGEPRASLKPGTVFEQVPESWRCPVCGQPKSYWKKISDREFAERKKNYDKLHPPKPAAATGKEKDIVDYMDIAREKLAGVCAVNKVCDGNPDRLCMGLKYGRAIGFGGAGQGRTFDANFRALEKYRLKMRVIKGHHEPEMEASFLGRKIVMPFMVTSMSGMKISMNNAMPEADFQRAMIEGAKLFGTIGMSGNTVDYPDHPGIEIIKENGGWGIPVFKPQSQERLLQLFKRAEAANVIAIGVDLDGYGSTNWALRGKPLYRKSEEDLKELVRATKKPVIYKGLMSVEDAAIVAGSGAKAMDVSNHGGRVMDSGHGVADVLPEIADEFKGKITIMADGAVRSGFDILKLLAIGADVVLAGRPLGRMALAGGAQAVKKHLEYFKQDLRMAMVMTGCDNIREITGDVVIKEKE
jgi:isopentenyl diphosphate isomerase/L-lactate dehydrogenase-like FMN-dependent dehydrogenase/rubredoxin